MRGILHASKAENAGVYAQKFLCHRPCTAFDHARAQQAHCSRKWLIYIAEGFLLKIRAV
jgi:hypothetical protein